MRSKPASKTNKERLIVALDVPTADDALRLIDELKGEVGAFKIGLQLFTSEGAVFVKKAVGLGARIFLDLKFFDIPHTVAKASVEVAKLGVWMFNVHIAGGGEMLRASAAEMRSFCEKEGLAVPLMIGVTVLTSADRGTLAETGDGGNVETRVVHLAQLAAKYELDGVVASPKDTPLIRETVDRNGFLVVTPGIRPSGSEKGDQKRVMWPAEALAAGSDYLVIGRPILRAPDRLAAVRGILSDIDRSSVLPSDRTGL